jgi:hypothetical protein
VKGKSFAARLETLWASHKKLILVVLCLGLGLIAAQRLASGFRELIFKPDGAVDLGLRYDDVHRWFGGESFAGHNDAVYPPASMVVLWPFVGWESWPLARWLWALTSLAVLAWLAWFAARECRCPDPWVRAVPALVPLAAYTARAVLVNGQLVLHLLPAILGGVVLVERGEPGWKRDLGAAGLMILAVTKPTVGAPFLLILLFARRPVRPIALVGVGYAALTAFGSLFQPGGLVAQLSAWYGRARTSTLAASSQSHANIASWLHGLGLESLNLPLSVAAVALLAALLYAFRRSDVWLRLSLAAVVARFWSFHFRYDDMLLVIPLIALIRVVARWRTGTRPETAALAMTALLGLSLMVPARVLMPGGRWTAIVESGQTFIWLAAAAYLAFRARREHRSAGRAAVPAEAPAG